MEKSHPPTIAPTIPRMMSRKSPSPVLLTILLPTNPATSPKMIQATSDMSCILPQSSIVEPVKYQGSASGIIHEPDGPGHAKPEQQRNGSLRSLAGNQAKLNGDP